MAYSSANVAAADLAFAAADKPMLGALAVQSATAAEWRTGGSFGAGADATASGYPASLAYDGYTDDVTKPDSSQTTWYYMLNLSGSPITFDGAAILGHNFGTITGLTVSIEIANNNAFSTNLLEVTSWSPGSSNDRLVDLVLGGATAQRYTDVPYARVKITGTSGAPEIGELVLFKRTQLPHKPNRPYNPQLTAQSTKKARTEAGVGTGYTRYRGARHLVANCTVDGASKITEVVTWFDDTLHGVRPWIWVEDPTTSPTASFFLMDFTDDDQDLDFDETGPNLRELNLEATEQGPDFLRLE